MTVAAALVITQGVSVGAPATTLEGTVVAGSVNFKNNDNTNVARWVFTLTDAPNGSALTAHVISDSMVTNNVNVVPDVPGTYRVLLQVYDGSGLQTATDAHDFVAVDTRGYVYPGFNDTDQSFNQPGDASPFGWKPPVNKILKDIHDHAFFLDQSNGASVGQTMVWNGSLWVPGSISGGVDVVTFGDDANVPTITDVTHNQFVGFENLTAARSVGLPAAPTPGQRITVADTDGTCSAVRTITLNAGALAIGTTSLTALVMTNPYETYVVEWAFDSDDPGGGGIWSIVSHVFPSAVTNIPAPPGATISNTATVAAFSGPVGRLLFTGKPGGYVLTIPNLLAGQRLELVHVGPTAIEGANAVTLSAGGGGYVLEKPQDRSQATASTQIINASYQNYPLWLDSTNGVVRCAGVV